AAATARRAKRYSSSPGGAWPHGPAASSASASVSVSVSPGAVAAGPPPRAPDEGHAYSMPSERQAYAHLHTYASQAAEKSPRHASRLSPEPSVDQTARHTVAAAVAGTGWTRGAVIHSSGHSTGSSASSSASSTSCPSLGKQAIPSGLAPSVAKATRPNNWPPACRPHQPACPSNRQQQASRHPGPTGSESTSPASSLSPPLLPLTAAVDMKPISTCRSEDSGISLLRNSQSPPESPHGLFYDGPEAGPDADSLDHFYYLGEDLDSPEDNIHDDGVVGEEDEEEEEEEDAYETEFLVPPHCPEKDSQVEAGEATERVKTEERFEAAEETEAEHEGEIEEEEEEEEEGEEEEGEYESGRSSSYSGPRFGLHPRGYRPAGLRFQHRLFRGLPHAMGSRELAPAPVQPAPPPPARYRQPFIFPFGLRFPLNTSVAGAPRSADRDAMASASSALAHQRSHYLLSPVPVPGNMPRMLAVETGRSSRHWPQRRGGGCSGVCAAGAGADAQAGFASSPAKAATRAPASAPTATTASAPVPMAFAAAAFKSGQPTTASLSPPKQTLTRPNSLRVSPRHQFAPDTVVSPAILDLPSNPSEAVRHTFDSANSACPAEKTVASPVALASPGVLVTSTTTSTATASGAYCPYEENRFQILTYDQVLRLHNFLNAEIPVHSRLPIFPTIHIRLSELFRTVKASLQKAGIPVRDIRLNGGAATYVIGESVYNFAPMMPYFSTQSQKGLLISARLYCSFRLTWLSTTPPTDIEPASQRADDHFKALATSHLHVVVLPMKQTCAYHSPIDRTTYIRK
ncbi:unnamed protein product, partial [Protopolystoma xenopodis]